MRNVLIFVGLLWGAGAAVGGECVATGHSPSYCMVTSSTAICHLPMGHQGARMWTSDDSGTSTIYLEVEYLDGALDPWYALERRCEVFTLPTGGALELHGSAGPEMIALTRGDEDLAPAAGSSLSIEVYGGDGEDLIVGSDAATLVQSFFGEGGDDVIYLRDAGGVADGGPGDDILWGGIEHDHLIGDIGDDTLHSGGGRMNELEGGPG
ncbi:MAG: calcium-binding protein, partial [Acidobacteriota bacterium]